MVERSGGLLTCLMPSVYPTDMLTGGILTWFGMFGAENASRYALQCICDLSMCCCCNYSFWLCFRGYAAMFDAWLFIFVWQVVSWHDLACFVFDMFVFCFRKHLCQVLYWRAGRTQQEHAKFQKTSVRGFFMVLCHELGWYVELSKLRK